MCQDEATGSRSPSFFLSFRVGHHIRGNFTPLANKAYSLRWGRTTRTGTTDAEGYLRESGLDGSQHHGMLTIGRLEIPIKNIAHVQRNDSSPLYWRLSNLGFMAPLSVRSGANGQQDRADRERAIALYRNSRNFFQRRYGERDNSNGQMGGASGALVTAVTREHDRRRR